MRNITIIGKGNGWELAPQDGESWGVNDLILRRNVSLVFQLHIDGNQDEPEAGRVARRKALTTAKALGARIVTQENYPLDKIIAKFRTNYFTNSISYMIALAIYEGVTGIDIYGVNMSLKEEYLHQRPNVEYWLGVAQGYGIDVTVHGKESTLLRNPQGRGHLYGFHYSDH